MIKQLKRQKGWFPDLKRIFCLIGYNFLLLILSPLMVIYLLWRLVIQGKSRDGFGQRLGFMPKMPTGEQDRIWVHAVSVGETVAARPILKEIKNQFPKSPLILSSTTKAGHGLATKSVPEADAAIYFPLDIPCAMTRSFNRIHPRLILTVETELWPNFFQLAKLRGIKTAIVNGRIAGKTLKNAAKMHFLYKWVLSNVDLFCMQTDLDAQHVISMGADPEHVKVVGNTKFDQTLPDDAVTRVQALRKLMSYPEGTNLFVAGSTNPGEDEPVLDAYLLAKEKIPGLQLLIAPRQIERGDEIAELAKARGLNAVCRSSLSEDSQAPEGSVVILNTIGELAIAFGLATVAFVGGSLIPKGGHNILQPLAWGKPVFFGPYMHKSKDSAELALSNQIGFQISDSKELGDGIITLMQDPERRKQISEKALEVMQQNRGAATRTAKAIAQLMESRNE